MNDEKKTTIRVAFGAPMSLDADDPNTEVVRLEGFSHAFSEVREHQCERGDAVAGKVERSSPSVIFRDQILSCRVVRSECGRRARAGCPLDSRQVAGRPLHWRRKVELRDHRAKLYLSVLRTAPVEGPDNFRGEFIGPNGRLQRPATLEHSARSAARHGPQVLIGPIRGRF